MGAAIFACRHRCVAEMLLAAALQWFFSEKHPACGLFVVTGINNNIENWIDDVRHWPKRTDEGNLLTT